MFVSDVASPVLFHGPTAQGRAAEAANGWGRVVGVYGHPKDGLNVETVREAVAMMASPPVGDQRGSVVVGPIDVLTLDGVADIFLKTLEERHPQSPRPFLWAWDVGSVRPTIQSRCLLEWSPGRVLYDKATMEAARSAVDAALARSTASVIEAFEEFRGKWKEDGDEFLRAAVLVLTTKEGPDRLRLWASIRSLLMSRDVGCDEAIARFLL